MEGHLVKSEWPIRHGQAESGRMTRLAREDSREVDGESRM